MTQELSKTFPIEGGQTSRRTLLTRLVPVAMAAAVLGPVASPALAASKGSLSGGAEALMFYNGLTGTGVTGIVNSDGTFTQVGTYRFDRIWTHIVGTNGMLLFYDASNGQVVTGRLDSNGVFTQLKGYPPGFLSTEWTFIVESNGLLFFYNINTGDGATGQIDSAGNFTQLQSFPAAFSTGWTIITSSR